MSASRCHPRQTHHGHAGSGQHCPRDIRRPQDGRPGPRVLHLAVQQHALGGLIHPEVGGPPHPPGSVPLKVGGPLTTSTIAVGTCPYSERSQRRPVAPGPVNGLVQLNPRWIRSHPAPRRTPSLHGAGVHPGHCLRCPTGKYRLCLCRFWSAPLPSLLHPRPAHPPPPPEPSLLLGCAGKEAPPMWCSRSVQGSGCMCVGGHRGAWCGLWSLAGQPRSSVFLQSLPRGPSEAGASRDLGPGLEQ